MPHMSLYLCADVYLPYCLVVLLLNVPFVRFAIHGSAYENLEVLLSEKEHQAFAIIGDSADVPIICFTYLGPSKRDNSESSDLVVHIVRGLMKVVRSQIVIIFAFPNHLRRVVALPHEFPESIRRVICGNPISNHSGVNRTDFCLYICKRFGEAQFNHFANNLFKSLAVLPSSWKSLQILLQSH